MKPSPSHDQSLTKAAASRGLTYPFGADVPELGETRLIQPGVEWARLPVPGSLKHINVWVLEDEGGIAIIDTGLHFGASKEAWTAVIGDRPVRRVFVTHFHPDHLGCAGWLCDTYDVPLWMNRTEYLLARSILGDLAGEPPAAALAQMEAAGWTEAQLGAMRARGWGNFARMVAPLPHSIHRLDDGDVIRIGSRNWTVKIGRGHSPEHACLIDFDNKLMIAGDQVLPRISSNVSVSLTEPDGDPLGEWLDSIERFRALPQDLLVLPAHGEPFYGLWTRLDQLADGHSKALDRLHTALVEAPRDAVDCFVAVFGRQIGDDSIGLATGEALAHLHHLEAQGRARRERRDGVWWWHAA